MSEDLGKNQINIGQTIDDAEVLGGYQKLIILMIAMVFAADGIANVLLPLSVSSISNDWGVPRDAFKTVMAFGYFGVAIGAAFGGMLSDRIGRRKALIGCMFLFGTTIVISSFVNNIQVLKVLKVFDGLGVGGAIPIGMALLAESMNKRRRSFAIALGMGFLPIGSTIASAMSSFVLPDWRSLFLICGIIPIVMAAIFLIVLPESPRFLVSDKKRWGALRKLMHRYGYKWSDSISFSDVVPGKQKGGVSALFDGELKTGTVMIWLAFFFCFIGCYSMFSWGPTMMMGQGFSLPKMGLGMSILSISGIFGSLLCGWLMERLGSRPAVLVFSIGSIAGALICSVILQDHASGAIVPLIAIGFFGFFIAGLLNANYTLGANLYPPLIKGTGIGAAASIGRVGAITSAYVGAAAYGMGEARVFFLVIAACFCVTMLGLMLLRKQIPRVA